MGTASTFKMSLFISTVLDNRLLLSVVAIDAALLLALLLIGISKTTQAARSYIFAALIIATLLFLFFQDQFSGTSEPGIGTFHTIHQQYS